MIAHPSVEFPLEEGGNGRSRDDRCRGEGWFAWPGPGEFAVKAIQTFESSLETIKPAAGLIIEKLKTLANPPDEIGVEFGIKLSADAKSYIASTGAEANYKVSPKWIHKADARKDV